jgi:hypothetical protein
MEMQQSYLVFMQGIESVSVDHPVGTDPMSRIDPKLRDKVIKVFIIKRY